MDSDRSRPNVLITGTPGVGKTTIAEEVANSTGFTFINIGEMVRTMGFNCGRDEERDCDILDEDRLLDELEPKMAAGGVIIDYHSCDFFPERWFNMVILLRSDNTVLYDRLKARGYSQKKITENVEAEIMNVVLEETYDSYKEEIIIMLQNDAPQDLAHNIDLIVNRIQSWKA